MKTETRVASSESAIGNNGNRTDSALLTDRASEAAHNTIDRIADNAAVAEQRVRGAVAEGEEQIREKQAEARKTTQKTIEQIRDYTKENPLMAAGIAFASGLLISKIVGR
jgi:ElaB/YqjD/DUF883 family membrane-anchored ribosome-binding protein